MLQLVLNGITAAASLAAVTLGFAMVLQWRQAPNFAHGATVSVGAYVAYALAGAGAGLPVALLAALLAGLAFGLMTEFLAIRIGAWMAHGVLVATLGIAVVTRASLAAIFGEEGALYPPRAVPSGFYQLGHAVLPRIQAQAFVLNLALLAIVWAALRFAPRGQRYALLGSNPLAAEICGMNRPRMNLEITAIAGGIAALAGAIAAPVGLIMPGTGASALVNSFVIAILAQSRMDFPRIILASLAVGLSEAFISLRLNADFQEALVYAGVIGVVLFSQRPSYGRA